MDNLNLSLTVTLSTLPDYAVLEISLPVDVLTLTVDQLLDTVFPGEESEAAAVVELFDSVENPDLTEIYEEFLRTIEQYRFGLCELSIANETGAEFSPESTVSALVPSADTSSHAGSMTFHIALAPKYDALAYAAVQGLTGGEPDLIPWLTLCLAIYFLDKHETVLPDFDLLSNDSAIRPIVEEVTRRELVHFEQGTNRYEITPEGRRFIGSLLSETEDYIDRYDILKDVVWDEESQTALFGTGHGEDLRVETVLLEGLDPVRTVFLLRLYDGSLDKFAGSWTELVNSEEFLNAVLEPVVDRSITPEEILEEILDQSMAILENTAEAAGDGRRRVSREGNP